MFQQKSGKMGSCPGRCLGENFFLHFPFGVTCLCFFFARRVQGLCRFGSSLEALEFPEEVSGTPPCLRQCPGPTMCYVPVMPGGRQFNARPLLQVRCIGLPFVLPKYRLCVVGPYSANADSPFCRAVKKPVHRGIKGAVQKVVECTLQINEFFLLRTSCVPGNIL